jgi:flagellar hook assembly protein FlgD
VAPGIVLSAPSPNPFRGSTSFTLDTLSGDLGAARVSIVDVTGRLVRELGSPVVAASRVMTWDGRNTAGHRVAAGTYVVSVEHAGQVATRSITVLP